MKKILLFIVGLFGIFGICFGADVSWISTSNNPIYNSSFSIIADPYSFNITGNSNGNNRCNSASYPGSTPSTIYITGNNLSFVSLNSLCIPKYSYSYGNLILDINGNSYTSYSLSDDSSYICFDFSNNPISLPDFSFTYYFYGSVYPTKRVLGLCFAPYTNYFSNSSASGNYYFKLNDDLFFTSNFPLSYSYYVGVPFTFSLSYGIIENPKFKINYGNTSTEYELTDNLNIYLKSPTIQNGNTFTYAGSTGINLFYNGTSQFYNKTELYLNTPSWFNNNVFTPICL